ncbi:Lrp/AsnC family transcriptional regulator [Bosea vaviloviae]|uniref:AsnC family transcriptional regulator n=1 Tax=Bosea vaviloviae TaxID=1526658 RepID=A0A1D7UC57_9HYPH|nr:Lrp/AsnC family transcriptional regulator [Bosea vaviloviae]AOO84955.1 AsnC family transcriptional regulator [Bosea vaviloviae]
MPPALDRFDRAILAILQKDNTTPQRVIGERVNLSAPAVQRRIKKMQEMDVITSNVAVVNHALVGQAITLFVEVELLSETARDIDEAKKHFLECPNVQQCYYVTGDVDFVLVMLVHSMEAYEDLTRELFFGNSNVKKFRTLVAMDRVKAGMLVSLDRFPA